MQQVCKASKAQGFELPLTAICVSIRACALSYNQRSILLYTPATDVCHVLLSKVVKKAIARKQQELILVQNQKSYDQTYATRDSEL
eukprot:4029288-Amphidinium_carterae.1